ncbi:MAG: hypothetical protein ACRBEE_00010 [Arenicella sp.]
MSKISIAIANKQQRMTPSSPQVQFIKRVGGLSIEEAIACLENGSSHPFYKTELYMNDHATIDEDIRDILNGMKNQSLEPYILERSYKDDWDSEVNTEIDLISKEALVNILDNAGDYE